MTKRIVSCIWAGLMVQAGLAQTHSATVRGIVADPSQAVIANAAVTLTNVDQQRIWRLQTDAAGEYVFVQIPSGGYALVVEAPGFTKHRREGLTLQVAQVVVIDVRLEVGAVTEAVEVTADSPLVEPGAASIGEVVTGRTIRSHPLNARNVTNLVALTPGINTSRAFRVPGSSSGAGDRVSFSAGGGRRLTNEVMLDGSPQVVMGVNQPAYIPTPDAVQEFNVQSNALPAEYGRTGGAVVNLVHRSGTKEFHGALYEFLRNDKLNANGFFQNRNGIPRAPLRVNQFGFVLGGPLTKSRNSTFFFFNYEGTRGGGPRAGTFTAPTPRMKNGDFSEIADMVYDPATIDASGRRRPFPDNRIPSDRWNPVGVNLLKFYPEPTLAGVANNFFAQAPLRVSERNFSVKIDQRVSNRQNVFGRLSWHRGPVESQDWFRNPASPGFRVNDLGNRSATLDDNLTLGGWVLHANYGYAYSAPLVDSPTRGFDVTSLGFPTSLRQAAQIPLFPTITVGGLAGLGPGVMQINGNKFETHTASGDATKAARGHTLKFGGTYRLNRASLFRPSAPAGAFNFEQGFTREVFNGNRGGHAVASLLLGLPSSPLGTGGRIGYEPALAVQVRYAALYFQDDWRATSRLTLNLGLRWDADRPLTERFDRTSWFDFNANLPVAVPGLGALRGGLLFAGRDGRPRGNKDPDNNNFAPRIGLAWRVANNVVLRSGFGALYSPTTGLEPSANNTGAVSFTSNTEILATMDSGRTPFATLSNPFPFGFAQPENGSKGLLTLIGQAINAQVRSDRVPYSMHWNFGLQYQLQENLLLDTAYAGSAGVGLLASAQLNQLPDDFLALGDELTHSVDNPFVGIVPTTSLLGTPRISAGQLLRPYPHLSGLVHTNGSLAHSSYHSLQVKFRKRYSRGLHLLAAYTWSKLLDDTSGIAAGDQNPGYTNNNRRRLDKSLSALDIAHRLVVNFQYELPLGAGHRFFSRGRLLRGMAGGWSLNGITTLQSGAPVSISSRGDTTSSFGGVQRPVSTGKTSRTPGGVRERLNNYLDRTAFVDAPPYTFGNVGRFLPDNRGPALQSWDLAIVKVTGIHESRRLEFRVDFFNLFNNVNFVPPVGNATVFALPQFGTITDAEAARIIQLGLKLHF